MRTYRLELILNERDLIEFLDQNPGYKPTVEGIREAGAAAEDAPTDVWHSAKTRKPRGRRKRTVETLQAAAE
jgi:hypothetical protein